MSRSKRARAKARKRPAPLAAETEASRFDRAKNRAAVVKLGTGAVAAMSIGGWMGLARVNYPGHHKRPTQPLAIPPKLYAVVRQNLLQAGIVAPATAPPDASTSSS